MMETDNKKGYHSTTPDPTTPQNPVNSPKENPDKTRKKEDNDPTKGPDIDITSTPNKKNTGSVDGLNADPELKKIEEEDEPQKIEEDQDEPYKRTKK